MRVRVRGSDPISSIKMPRTLTFGFKVCLLELNVLIPRNKKLFRFDELRDELNIK